MGLLPADIQLARQLELTETQGCVEYATAHHLLNPECQTATVSLMGGFAVFAGSDSPITQAFGMGLQGSITASEFDDLESFYFDRKSAVNIELCPLADQSMVDQLNARGYRVVEFSNVLYRKDVSVPDEQVSGVIVRRPAMDEADLWASVVSQGFTGSEDPGPAMLEIARTMFFTGNSNPLLVELNGTPAAGGAVAIRGKIANFLGHATIPAFRGRGAQYALIGTSVRLAAELGCQIVMAATLPGSTSQRNFERHGFRIAYTRTKFARDFQ